MLSTRFFSVFQRILKIFAVCGSDIRNTSRATTVTQGGLQAGALVDRTLCSEFQMLEELCDNYERAGAMFPVERRLSMRGGVPTNRH